MPITLFDTLKPDKEGFYLRPATDGEARIVLEPAEASAAKTFKVKFAQASWLREGAWHDILGWDSWHDPDADWTATLTPNRLLIWSPMSSTLMGKLKRKAGKATGGQVRYSWVGKIFRDGQYNIFFEVDNKPGERIDSMRLSLDFEGPNQARSFALALTDALAAHHKSQGVESEKLTAELAKLRDADWTASTYQSIKVSLFETGARIFYPPS